MAPRAIAVTGLSLGDEGKGSIVDALCRKAEASLCVRHNGGAQAGHNVTLTDGRHHTFAQWGAGTLAGVPTLLSQHMITHPLAMINEAEHLRVVGVSRPWDMLTVDARALVITPYHQMANRLRETRRGSERHGSCGVGVGEAYEDRFKQHAIRFGELSNRATIMAKLDAIRHDKRTEFGSEPEFHDAGLFTRTINAFALVARGVRIVQADRVPEILKEQSTVIFEGAQGVLLDQFRGVQPYTTWSNTTSENAREMAAEAGIEVTKIGVLRAYVTRHGPGPLATYDEGLTAAVPDQHNPWNPWQRAFRCGWFDVPLAKHAISVEDGIDKLALTCIDRLAGRDVTVVSEDGPQATSDVVSTIELYLGRKAAILSYGPTADDKREVGHG